VDVFCRDTVYLFFISTSEYLYPYYYLTAVPYKVTLGLYFIYSHCQPVIVLGFGRADLASNDVVCNAFFIYCQPVSGIIA